MLTDSLGNSARYEENIPTEKVAFHLKEGGKGAAFGKAAETEGLLELAEDWHLKLTGATDLNAAAEKIAVLDPGGVVRYRTKAELLGDLAADYIVEQGVSGIWTYRKWAGGVAECWGEVIVNTAITEKLGAMAFAITPYFAWPSGLFSTAPKNIYASSVTTAPLLPVARTNEGSSTQVRMYLLYPETYADAINWVISVHAIGKWK